jgi:hypothetical protein
MLRIAGPLRSLPCALVALALILATAAWGAHSVSHGLDVADAVAAATAPADGHHAHRDKQDGGHDHLQGFSFPAAALPDGTDLAPPPLPAAAPPAVRVATLAFRPADPPLPDPPRNA